MENIAKYTQVILYREDNLIKFREPSLVKKVLPLNPNALSYIPSKNQKIIDFSKLFSDCKQCRVLAKSRHYEKKFNSIVDKNKNLGLAGKEACKNLFSILMSSYLSINEILKSNGPWLILDNKEWKQIDNLEKAAEIIFLRFFEKVYGRDMRASQQKLRIIPFLINKLIFSFFIKKNYFFITGLSYNLKKISQSINKLDDTFRPLFILNPDEYSAIRSIKSFLGVLFNIKNPNEPVGIVPIKNTLNDYSKIIWSMVDEINVVGTEKTIDFFSSKLNIITKESESYVDFLVSTFKKKRPSFIIAHHARWKEATNLCFSAQKENIPIYLISHGSHTDYVDVCSGVVLRSLGNGLLGSNFEVTSVLQSPLAQMAFKQMGYKNKSILAHPLMWGVDKKPNIKNNNNFTILYAGTYKLLGSRLWIYETSSEFLKGIKKLISSINEINNIRLIIRIREEKTECDIESLRKFLTFSSKVELSFKNTFKEDLDRSDLLISFSSTTIEEALYAKKPVALFGGSNRYRHIREIKDLTPRKPVYNLSYNNLTDEIVKIKKLHYNKPLNESELKNFIWDNSIINQEEFLRLILTRNECKT